MYITNIEKIWRYLHDDRGVVDEYLFVTDPYRYTSNFIDMISRSPEVLPELKTRMKRERDLSGPFGLFMRSGYGLAEYRIIKMMKIVAFSQVLESEFGEILNEADGPRLRRDYK